MRYHLPEGCSALSFEGKRLAVAGDKTVELDDRAAAALQPHGLSPLPPPAAKPAEPTDRQGKSPDRQTRR